MIRLVRQYLAVRRLQRLVERERNSFRCEQFRRRRQAALKGRRRVARV